MQKRFLFLILHTIKTMVVKFVRETSKSTTSDTVIHSLKQINCFPDVCPFWKINNIFTLTCYVTPNIPNNIIWYLETDSSLIYNAHTIQSLLLQLNKIWHNLGIFLLMESSLRRVIGCFNDNAVCVSPKICLIDSFGLCFSFWLIHLTNYDSHIKVWITWRHQR